MQMKIFLTNLGKYNEGELVGKWFDLPIYDIEDALLEIGVAENTMYEEYFISDYSSDIDIKISSYEGIVEDLGMRVTKIRDFSGELHIIPNGEIHVVTNRTRGAMRALVSVGIAYEEDIDRAIKVIDKVAKEIRNNNESILDGPTVQGVVALDASSVVIRVVAKTEPMEQWAVERELMKKIKEAFDRENIEIPYSKMVVYKGESE